jgi:hypothetical protein
MVSTVVRGKPKENIKISCTSCGNERNPTDFYTSNSPFHKHTGKLHICKECFWKFVDDDVEKLKVALRMSDKPFLVDLLQSSQEEAEKGNKNLIKIYMKNVGMPQYKNSTWLDSISNNEKEFNITVEDSSSFDENSMIRKWGRGYSASDLEYLENFFAEYSHSYATDTPVQVNLYKNIAKVHLQAERELSANQTKGFKELMELSSKLHNDGNIKPIQSTGANDDKGVSTYGLWIKTIEQDEPCEFFENKPIYEDFDKFKKYIDDWFVRPFKNIFNISKDFNVREEDE